MKLDQIKPTIDSRMRTILQGRRVVPAPGQPLPTSTRVDDAADVCGTTVEVVMEHAIGQLGHDDAWRRVEAERVASFLGGGVGSRSSASNRRSCSERWRSRHGPGAPRVGTGGALGAARGSRAATSRRWAGLERQAHGGGVVTQAAAERDGSIATNDPEGLAYVRRRWARSGVG